MSDNEFDNWSDTKLEYELQQTMIPESRNKILTELEKRNKKKDEQSREFTNETINLQFPAACCGVTLCAKIGA